MFKKTSRLVAITFALSAPFVAAAGSSEVKLDCPAGTQQVRAQDKTAWFCKKTEVTSPKSGAHGPYVRFHENGQKWAVGQHTDGSRTGLWTFFDETGAKTEEIEFSGNNYHGRRVQFFRSGQMKLDERWVNGKREGMATAYAENGQKVSEQEYRGGHMVKEQKFENGKPVAAK
jgi:hypothetical protein